MVADSGEMGVLDFAGGLVVHLTAGVQLVDCENARQPSRFPTEIRPPHNPGLTMMSASMLWVGWFGFNAGNAMAANGDAGMAMLVTHISAATGSLVWLTIEWMKFGKPSLVGIIPGWLPVWRRSHRHRALSARWARSSLGSQVGLSVIMPSALLNTLKIDDSLDVFAVHGVGGAIGILLVAVLVGTVPVAPGLVKA